MPDDFHVAARAEEIPENGTHLVSVGPWSILFCRVGGEVFAVENRCPHQNSPLEGGRLRRGMILCPQHGMGFELKTGQPKGNLTQVPLRTFPVRVVNEAVEVQLPSPEGEGKP
jgi:3-phenylpropionate/trans-cinnamate dioxygenase ferredoxin subunit